MKSLLIDIAADGLRISKIVGSDYAPLKVLPLYQGDSFQDAIRAIMVVASVANGVDPAALDVSRIFLSEGASNPQSVGIVEEVLEAWNAEPSTEDPEPR